jgi:D-aminopeptidase
MLTARDLPISLGGFEPGPSNAITDVAGVRVGHVTIEADAGVGKGAVRTGVTCVWPHEAWPWEEGVFAGVNVLNGEGELIGICQIQDLGLLRSPILLTSSLSIGAVYDAAAKWAARHDDRLSRTNFFMPVVAEVSDLILSDNRAFPITADHVEDALSRASTAPPAQGSVGAGTGTIAYGLKGGIGTASRRLARGEGDWTIGALVLTNHGERRNLTIGGVNLGPLLNAPSPPKTNGGSCVVVVATDAPLLPHQLRRIAVRAGIGVTRSGAFVGHTSGEIALAFSTACRVPVEAGATIGLHAVRDSDNPAFDLLFEATVDAVHEAVLNSLLTATTTTGFAGVTAHALSVQETAAILGESIGDS